MPACEPGQERILLVAPEDRPEYGIEAGDVVASCPSIGVVYVPPFSAAALAELLFPDDWSVLPPG